MWSMCLTGTRQRVRAERSGQRSSWERLERENGGKENKLFPRLGRPWCVSFGNTKKELRTYLFYHKRLYVSLARSLAALVTTTQNLISSNTSFRESSSTGASCAHAKRMLFEASAFFNSRIVAKCRVGFF